MRGERGDRTLIKLAGRPLARHALRNRDLLRHAVRLALRVGHRERHVARARVRIEHRGRRSRRELIGILVEVPAVRDDPHIVARGGRVEAARQRGTRPGEPRLGRRVGGWRFADGDGLRHAVRLAARVGHGERDVARAAVRVDTRHRRARRAAIRILVQVPAVRDDAVIVARRATVERAGEAIARPRERGDP